MKTFNFFEKLWEHGRTLRRVGLVLVMCLTLGATHAYATDYYLRYQKSMPAGNYDGNTSQKLTQFGSSNRYYCELNLSASSSYGFFIRIDDSDTKCYKANATASTNQEIELFSYDGQHGNSNHRVTYTTGSAGTYIFTYDINNHKISVSPKSSQTVKVAWSIASGHDGDYNLGTYTTLSQEGSSSLYSADVDLTAVKHYMFVQTDNNRYWKNTATMSAGTYTYVYDYGTNNYGDSGNKNNFTPSAAGKYRFTWDHDAKMVKYERLYKVTYYGNGNTGGSVPSVAYQVSGGTLTAADNTGLLVKTGKVFAGWATTTGKASAGTIDYAPGATITMSAADVDLYAVWTNGSYFISVVGATTNGTLDPDDVFLSPQSLTNNAATEVNGVTFSKSYYATSANQTSLYKIYQYPNKCIVYDTKTTNTKLRVYVKNTNGSSKNIYYHVAKEGELTTSDQIVSVDGSSGKVITIDASSTKGARVFISSGGYADTRFTQIIAIETGSALPKVGETGYELAFPGRAANTFPLPDITIEPRNPLKLDYDAKLVMRTDNYVSFTTTAATKLRITTEGSNGVYVCTDKTNYSTTGKVYGGSTDTYDVNLMSSGTYYIVGENSSNSTITKVAFADFVACTAPTRLAASDITAGGVTLTVTDGSTRDYEFYVSTSSTEPTASSTPTHSVTGNKTKAITGLTASTEYYAWVRAKADYFNKSSWVALTGTSFTTEGSSCTVPTSPTITGTTSYTYGDEVELTASASNTDASTTYAWYLGDPDDDGVLKQAASTSGASYGGVLDVADAGTYYCVIANSTCTAKASKTITIAKAAISPSLSYASTSLIVDDVTAVPTISGNTGSGAVSYSSSATGVATVASDGKVTAKAAGSATITATIAATANYLGNTATATFTVEDPCFYATDLKKKSKGSDISDGAEITASMLASGTITGGTLHNTSGATLGHNETYGIVYNSASAEVTVTLSGVALQEGSLIKLTGYSNNSTNSVGFLVGGVAMSEGDFTPASTAYTAFTRTYTVGSSSSLKDKTTFTITRSTSTKVYLTSIRISGCQDVYTVTLDKNDGTGGESETTVLAGKALTTVTPPTKTGYTFDGYYDGETDGNGSGTKYYNANGTSAKNWDKGASATLHAKWTANKYTITLDNQCAYSDGTHDGGSATEFEVTYGTNYFTYYMTAEPSSYNYDFGGWYTAVGGGGDQIITYLGSLASGATAYTNASGKWNYDGNPTVYAKWSKSYTTGLSEGINANGGSGGAITLTYNSSATSGFTPSTRTGYLLAGYYTASDGGSKVINADGSIVSGDVDGYVDDGKWAYCSSTTFKIYAHWTPITYTIAFDKNDDASYLNSDSGTDPDNIAATYAVSYTIPACPYTRTGYSFVGWSTAAHKAKGSVSSTPALDYDYRGNYPASNLSSTQGATVTLYPKWQGNEYTISFNPRGGSVYPTSKDMRYGETYGSNFYDGELPEPDAPTGKAFVGWYTSPTGGTPVTKDTQLSTVGAHTLYARYSDIATVYFKNTIGWSEVYVTYAAYWDTYADKGTGNNGLTYHKMSLVPGTTDIYKDEIPSAILANWTAGDNSNIAFNSQELLTDKDKHAPTTGDYNNYDKGEVVFRHDFDSRATMFVPRDKNTNDEDGNYKKNSAQYISTGYSGESSNPKYTSGYWMKYGDTYSGYLFSYQKALSGSWSTEYGMNTSVAGDTIFVYTMAMDANTRYDLRIRKDCQTTNTKSRQFRYGTQITSAACTDLKLVCDPNNNSWMQTTTAGEYKFILTCKKDGHMYLTVEYPLAVNDYQVLYSWNDGSAKTYASEVIRANAGTVDTISVFVHKLESPVISRSMKIQKCTGINGSGVPTWTDVTGGGIDLTDVKATGVYDFEITQPETGDPTGAFAGKYEADYYIRTACSDGGWDQYLEREDNVMTYSAYSMTQTLSDPYSHYYCRYVGSTSTDITFAIATKYSPNISGTKTGDATIGNAATTLPANANVRFSWNEETNAMARAYIKDAQGPSNARFMVMHGADDDMIFNPNGSAISASGSLAANELQFDDMGDWIYQVMLQAKPGAEVSIIANYNNADRYLVGGASSYTTIMGGDGDNQYTIMAVYDFKTNRLMNAWTPDGDITDKLSDVDMLWIRYKQNAAQQITFGVGGALTNVKVVGAIQLDYDDLVGHVASWTYETRPLLRYYISFPFDVNVSDIFGLHGAELGRDFVIRKYDGAGRAKNCLYLGDGDTYWVDLTMDDKMNAHEGYSLVFDNEYLNGDLGSIWENKTGGSSVYLYFPAATEIAEISEANKAMTIDSHACTTDKSFDYKGSSVNHTNTDSHWNLIGSPLFVNSYIYDSDGTNGQTGTAARTTLDSYYEYNVTYNYWEPKAYYSGGAYYACKAMHAMLVQFAGSVTWSQGAPAAPASMPARERKEKAVTNRLITLNLLQNGEEKDQTFIKLAENGNPDFMLCEDMFKIDNTKIPNIFSYASGNPVAYNKVTIESQIIPLGLDIRADGTYTFEMPENVAAQVILVDKFDGTRTNLNLEDYEIYLNRGGYYDRFELEININKVPTAIDGVTDGEGSLKDGKAHKYIENGQMYILQNGLIYDAQGKRVQ